MTLDELELIPRETLTAEQVAGVYPFHPQAIRMMAREGRFPTPVAVHGTRVHIIKRPFIKYMKGE